MSVVLQIKLLNLNIECNNRFCIDKNAIMFIIL